MKCFDVLSQLNHYSHLQFLILSEFSFFVSGISGRPRKLKVVINPRSKKGQARLVYLKHVAPLFEKAGIRADIMSEFIR